MIDEFLLCDELGMNVLAIEHHAGINSLLSSNPMLVGILARQTRKARILSLGTLVSLRHDPVRAAEEYATADVISRGRLEIGFVKSGGSEMASANANPVGNVERYWEAIDLITKALSSHDGPFSWEGKHFTHRHVNIWPRPWQKPHPRMWCATGDPETAAEVGRRGLVHVLVLRGPEGTKRAYAAYRNARAEAGLPKVTTDKFAYAALAYVGDTDEEGVRVGSKLLWFLNTSLKSAPQFAKFLPGAMPPRFAPQVYRTAPSADAPPPLENAEKGVAPAGVNAARLISIDTGAGDGAGHSLRRQSRQRLSPDHGILRPRRRLRAPVADRPQRLHDARRVGKGHPPLRDRSPAAPQGGEAGRCRIGALTRPPPRTRAEAPPFRGDRASGRW